MSISLAMIVKNEETILGDCLTSIRDLVDEMIVVDTGSTDYTKLIADSTGAKVFDFEWCDDFAKARNESLRHCNSDWILILDADEAIDPSDHDKIRRAVDSEVFAFNLPIWNYLPHREIVVMDKSPLDNPNFGQDRVGGNFPCYASHEGMRLFRNPKEPIFIGKIHETPDDYFNEKGYKVSDLDVVIHHAGKMQFAREDSKKEYYLELALQETIATPDNARSWFNVFQQALVADKPGLVLKAAKEHLRIRGGLASPIIFIGSGIALRELGRTEDSLACFDAVLKLDPTNVVALAQKKISLGEK